jgi:porphobilinogen synthase
MIQRFRRLRTHRILRDMVADVMIQKKDFIYPIFIEEGKGICTEIPSMPGQYRYSPDTLPPLVENLTTLGVKAVILFGIPAHKDENGSGAYDPEGIIPRGIDVFKKENRDILVITDICLCEYTSHGHCGVVKNEQVDNDLTLPLLAQAALVHVRAGADMVAPSDMMDGRVAAIRTALDHEGYINTPIMCYSVKYCSGYYGPFRDAAGSAPGFGNRKGYQMDFRRREEGIAKAESDRKEGADILMVKPALAYLDIISRVKEGTGVPLAAYNVSGEYAMVKAAAEKGWIDEQEIVMENMYAVKRAGADLIISYHTPDIFRWMDEKGED